MTIPNPIVTLPSVLAVWLTAMIGVEYPLVGLALAVPTLAICALTYRVFQLHNTLPRATIGREVSDLSIGERALRFAPGVKRADCGCLYSTQSLGSSRPDRIEVDEDPAYVWERRPNGARVKYELKKETMKRCTSCGRHVHERDNVRLLNRPDELSTVRHKIWEDDPLPDDIAETNYEIIELEG